MRARDHRTAEAGGLQRVVAADPGDPAPADQGEIGQGVPGPQLPHPVGDEDVGGVETRLGDQGRDRLAALGVARRDDQEGARSPNLSERPQDQRVLAGVGACRQDDRPAFGRSEARDDDFIARQRRGAELQVRDAVAAGAEGGELRRLIAVPRQHQVEGAEDDTRRSRRASPPANTRIGHPRR